MLAYILKLKDLLNIIPSQKFDSSMISFTYSVFCKMLYSPSC